MYVSIPYLRYHQVQDAKLITLNQAFKSSQNQLNSSLSSKSLINLNKRWRLFPCLQCTTTARLVLLDHVVLHEARLFLLALFLQKASFGSYLFLHRRFEKEA
jgi:hypothetical protein